MYLEVYNPPLTINAMFNPSKTTNAHSVNLTKQHQELIIFCKLYNQFA